MLRTNVLDLGGKFWGPGEWGGGGIWGAWVRERRSYHSKEQSCGTLQKGVIVYAVVTKV